jgi:hypothetical protein
MHFSPDTMTDEVADDTIPPGQKGLLDGGGDVPYPVARLGRGDACQKGFLGIEAELAGARIDGAHHHGPGVVADEAVAADDHVERDQVAFADDPVRGADAMDDLVVEGDADVARVAQPPDDIAVAGALASMAAESRPAVEMPGTTKVARSCRTRAAAAHAARMRPTSSADFKSIIPAAA